MKTTLFLGAGASVFAGMPTTKKLVRMVYDSTLRQEDWESPGAKRLAVNIAEAYSGKDVEELYSAIRDMIDVEKQHMIVVDYKTKKDNRLEIGYDKRIITSTHIKETAKNETEDVDETIRVL